MLLRLVNCLRMCNGMTSYCYLAVMVITARSLAIFSVFSSVIHFLSFVAWLTKKLYFIEFYVYSFGIFLVINNPSQCIVPSSI